MSHKRIVPSKLPLANSAPSGEKASVWTSVGCPQKVARFSPLATSHNRIATSFIPIPRCHHAPETRYRPHGEKARANGHQLSCAWGSVIKVSPRLTSHNRIFFAMPQAIIELQGENAIASILSGNSPNAFPLSTSHSRDTGPSRRILTRHFSSGLNATEWIQPSCAVRAYNCSLPRTSRTDSVPLLSPYASRFLVGEVLPWILSRLSLKV